MFELIFLVTLTAVGVAIGIEGAAIGVGAFFLSISKVATLLLLFVGLLQFATARVRMPSGSKTVWLTAFAISLFVSGLYSFGQGTPAEVLQNVWFAYPGLILLYFLLSVCVSDVRRLNAFLWGMCVGMVIASVLALRGVGSDPTAGEYGVERLGGIAGNSNEVAYHLVIVIAVSMSFAITAKTRLRRYLSLGLFVFLVFGMVATVSRSGILALMVMGLFWMVRFRRLDYVKYAIPIMAIAPLIILLAPTETKERLQSSEQGGRLVQLEVAVRAFASNPLIGIGPARIPEFARKNGIPLEETIHNVVLKYASEHGLFGLVPFVAIVFLTWRSLGLVYFYVRRGGTNDPQLVELAWRACFLQLGIVGMVVIAQFHPQTTDKFMWSVFGLATAIEQIFRVRLARLAGSEIAPPEPVAFDPRASAAVLSQPPGLRTAPTETSS